MAKSEPTSVSLKEHFAALREADLRAVELTRAWTQERLASHNDLLNKWRDATEKDRTNFVSAEAFNALKSAFDVYKDITAKALALAEGKTSGVGQFASIIVQIITGLASMAANRHGCDPHAALKETRSMSIGTILLIVIVIALLGGFSGLGGGPFYGTGYYGGGGLGLGLVIVLILVVLGRI